MFNTTGSKNTAFGSLAMKNNDLGSDNTAIGYQTMQGDGNRSNNTAIGSLSQGGASGTFTNSSNTSVGYNSLNAVTSGSENTAIGKSALYGLTTANYNTALGSGAGGAVVSGSTVKTTGDYGIYLGYNAVALAASSANEIVIGSATSVGGYNTGLGNNSTLIGNSATTNARIMGALNLPNTTASTSSSTGALTVGGGAGIGGAIYAGSIQNTPIGSTTASTGAFTTLAASGNATVAGTLAVTGATTLSSTLGVTGNLAINTNKFTVDASTGNTLIAGTIEIDGGSPGAGKVLVSDANGVASWSANSNGGVSLITATATMAATDTYNLIVFSGSTASQTITLPSASLAGAGREITIKNIASVPVSINATAGNLISDSTTTAATSLSIGIEPSNNWIKAISTGSNWIILRALF